MSSRRASHPRSIVFHILTAFPGVITNYFHESLFARAQKRNLVQVHLYDLRDYADVAVGNTTSFARRTIDDRPYGGGAGMVLKIGPIFRAIADIKKNILKKYKQKKKRIRVLLPSTRGAVFDADCARRLSRYDHLIFICGRYEGVDERVADYLADEEISIGSFILSGGELAAAIITEATARFLPGFLGNEQSLEQVQGSYPSYTRPDVFHPADHLKASWRVPKVLLSGNHEDIRRWRAQFHRR